MEITKPIKSINGTNSESLQMDYINAMNAINEAVEKIYKIEFNARDYATMNDFYEAKKERQNILSNLNLAYLYFEDVAISLN